MGHRVAAWQERVPENGQYHWDELGNNGGVALPRDLTSRPLPATEALHSRFRRQ